MGKERVGDGGGGGRLGWGGGVPRGEVGSEGGLRVQGSRGLEWV